MGKRKYAVWLLPLLLVIALFVVILILGEYDNKRFERDAVSSTARISHIGSTVEMKHTGTTRVNLAYVQYEYEVNGEIYAGDLNTRLCDYKKLEVGATVAITYLQSEPNTSRCTPHKQSEDQTSSTKNGLLLLLALASGILVIAYGLRWYEIKIKGMHDPD